MVTLAQAHVQRELNSLTATMDGIPCTFSRQCPQSTHGTSAEASVLVTAAMMLRGSTDIIAVITWRRATVAG